MRGRGSKIAIATMVGENQGNRLQNYALQLLLENESGMTVETLQVGYGPVWYKRVAKKLLWRVMPKRRWACFERFNSDHIHWSCYSIESADLENAGYALHVIGSDQVWNPTFRDASYAEYLPQVPKEKKRSYAASFGVREISENRGHIAELLKDIEQISVREDAGADIVEDLIGERPPVVLDPTMLVDAEVWRSVARKPDMSVPEGGYILKYVLGNNVENDYTRLVSDGSHLPIIDLKDRSLPVGPAEFVWLIQHATFVCTDSFHASVFSVLMHVPFAIFERVSKHKDMSSRFDTFCAVLGLDDRRVRGRKEALGQIDWQLVDDSLEAAREKSMDYLRKIVG